MDQQALTLLVAAALIGLVCLGIIVRRQAREDADADADVDQALGVSSEGMKVCPHCGRASLWTERTCSTCGGALRG